jgi:hypothetical protein
VDLGTPYFSEAWCCERPLSVISRIASAIYLPYKRNKAFPGHSEVFGGLVREDEVTGGQVGIGAEMTIS